MHISRKLILLLCFCVIVIEGYDLIVYGTVLPTILKTPSWGLTPATAGLIGSCSLVGLLIGSLFAGALADRLGRRRTLIVGTVWFSSWMAVCALPAGVPMFGIARFMVGLGVGSAVAAAGVTAVEFAPRGRGQSYSAIAWTGAAAGGIASSLLALALLSQFGPRVMFWLGALPLVVLVPALAVLLPESPEWLRAHGRTAQADAIAADFRLSGGATPGPAAAERVSGGMRGLFSRDYLRVTVLLGLLSILTLLLVYGLSTWLPVLMQSTGHSPSTSLLFLLLLSAGGMLVPVLGGRVADLAGPRVVTASVLALAAVCIVLLTADLPTPVLLALAFLTGGGTLGAQVLIYGFAANFYPASCRASGVAWVSAAGRLGSIVGPVVTGLIVGAGASAATSLVLFASVAVVAAVCTGFVRHRTAFPSESRPPRAAEYDTRA
ncbi:MFS transporter [Amycolatopsis benzoatilytica]|uniref:MFS transporter n=1 Tax=Amycolatopsis benzoatilytica TaxID=346045 RepID=UPI0003706574|nr:MFS transporter [Amycolatopsis benzoatilytica]